MWRSNAARRFFSVAELERIAGAIAALESATSAEVRVHLEDRCPGDALRRAREVFAGLAMHETRERNGVLLYLATVDRKVAVIGDEAVDRAVPPGFWREVCDELAAHMARGRRQEAVLAALERIGTVLRRCFPCRDGAENELPDEVSIG